MKHDFGIEDPVRVKPCIPTPPNLKNYKFSFMDEILPLTEVGILLFYATKHDPTKLEESLAKVLVQFYPLASRFSLEECCVDCSDQSAELVAAVAPEAELGALIAERDLEKLYGFLPRRNHRVEVSNYSILSIQITDLASCGGVVIGITVSHKIFDASSVGTFVAAWSETCNNIAGDGVAHVTPSFDSWAVCPGTTTSSKNMIHSTEENRKRVSIQRFTFDKEAVARLRSRAGDMMKPSKVRLVSGVIAKALIAVDRARDII